MPPKSENDKHADQLAARFEQLQRGIVKSPHHIFAFSRVRKLGGTKTRPLTDAERTSQEQATADREFFERVIRWAEAGLAIAAAMGGHEETATQTAIEPVPQESNDDDGLDFD